MRFSLVAVLVALPAWADFIDAGTGLRIDPVPMLRPDGGPHTLSGPTDMRFLPDGRIVLVEKFGTVKIRGTDGVVSVAYQFCVDSSSEKGLLGVAVDPNFNGT